MGEVDICGHAAAHFVNHIFTNDVMPMKKGQILYGMMCYENGGVVDDLLVYKRSEELYTLVINAANIDKDIEWLRQNLDGWNAEIRPWDVDAFGQLAIQGPESERVMEQVLSLPCRELTFYTFKELPAPERGDKRNIIVSRTGYTGEDGFEVYGHKDFIRMCWDKLMAAGIQPCGLGCRDTLRFEVGLPLYGDELSADISPVMAGLSMFVKLDKPATADVRGDVTGDGKVTVDDATRLQSYLAEYSVPNVQKIKKCGDANRDGVIDIRDITAIQRYLADVENTTGIGEAI